MKLYLAFWGYSFGGRLLSECLFRVRKDIARNYKILKADDNTNVKSGL